MLTASQEAERAGLLADVVANPGDDGPRLVYADWLEDAGAGRQSVFSAVRGGAEGGAGRWQNYDIPALWACGVLGWRARLGFVEEVDLPLAAWLERGPALVAAHPLLRVRLTGVEPHFSNSWRVVLPFEDAGYLATISDGAKNATLPACLWESLPGGKGEGVAYKVFESRGHAIAALSAACLAWARGRTRQGA